MSALQLPNPTFSPSTGLGRFRLIDQRPQPNTRRRPRRTAHPFRTALLCTALPALVLVCYVSLWSAAVNRGYQEQQLARAIQSLRIENQALQAQVRQLQSPTRIFQRAAQLGMQEAKHTEYVLVPR